MGKFSRLGNDLYTGRRSIDFVGRRWLWYAISGVHRRCWPSSGSSFKGLNYGIEFTGGARVPRHAARPTRSPRTTPTSCARPSPAPASTNAAVAGGHHLGQRARSWSRPSRSPTTESDEVVDAILQTTGVGHRGRHLPDRDRRRAGARRSPSARCSASCVFLVLVVLFIWAYFREWKMSVAAIVALAHDVVITIGVYALSGFEVTPGDGHRPADDPRLLALRHRRGLRQGPREHQATCEQTPDDVRRGGQPRRQPDPGALDQHLDRGADPGRRDPLRQRGPARLGLAQGPRAGAVRRHGRRRLLLDLHRHAAAGAPEVAARARSKLAEKRAKAARRARRPTATPSVPAFTEDMPVADEPGDRRRLATTDAAPAGEPATGRAAAPEATRPRPRRAAAAAAGRARAPPSGRQQPTRQPRSKRGKK